MPSCSVQHCVLFLLTLTFTTDPGSAVVFPMYAKLHQSVTLPCECSSQKPKWSLDSNRDVVFAQCDQTSCRSKDGYEMSRDQYLNGDFSLIITNPDYSMRKTYTCECDYSDYVTVRLRIDTMFSEVQKKPEGDLKLDLSVPESVEVIYKSRDSADGVQICTVTNRTLQCNTEYTPRTSLSNSELTLRDVMPWNSGTYTIRNLDYKEDIRVYAVSVSAVFSEVQMKTEGDLKLDLSVPESVEVIYRGSVSADGVQICTVTNRTLQCNTEYTPRTSLSNSELTLRDMWRGESGTYTIRDTENNRDIRVYAVSVSGYTSVETAGIVIAVLLLLAGLTIAGVTMFRKREKDREVKSDMKAVDDLMGQAVVKPTVEMKKALQQVEEKIKALEQKYSGDREYKEHVTSFCNRKRKELVKSLIEGLDQLVEKYKNLVKVNAAMEQKEAAKKDAQNAIITFLSNYQDHDDPLGGVNIYLSSKLMELDSEEYFTEEESAKQVINMMEEAVEKLNNLKREAEGVTRSVTNQELTEMTSLVKSHLLMINTWCRGRIDELGEIKDHEAGNNIGIRHMKAFLKKLQKWSKDNEPKLTEYMKKIKSREKKLFNKDPKPAHNEEGEEKTPLTKV